jgi:hypothetical protein
MRYFGPGKFSEVASPPTKRRTSPSEQTDEASGLIESEQVDVEREAPVEENESIERSERRDNPGPPAFED